MRESCDIHLFYYIITTSYHVYGQKKDSILLSDTVLFLWD